MSIQGQHVAEAVWQMIQRHPKTCPVYRDVPAFEADFPVTMRDLVERDWPWDPADRHASQRRLYERQDAAFGRIWGYREYDPGDGEQDTPQRWARNGDDPPLALADLPDRRPRGPVAGTRHDYSYLAPAAKAFWDWAECRNYHVAERVRHTWDAKRHCCGPTLRQHILDHPLDVNYEYPLFKLVRWAITETGQSFGDVFPWGRGHYRGYQWNKPTPRLWNVATLPVYTTDDAHSNLPVLVEFLDTFRRRFADEPDRRLRLPEVATQTVVPVDAGGGVRMLARRVDEQVAAAEDTLNLLAGRWRFDLLGARWDRAIRAAIDFAHGPIVRASESDWPVEISDGRSIERLLGMCRDVTRLKKAIHRLAVDLERDDRGNVVRTPGDVGRKAARFWAWLVARLAKVGRIKRIEPRQRPGGTLAEVFEDNPVRPGQRQQEVGHG